MGFEVSGFGDLMADLESLGQALDGPVVTEALERGAEPILDRAKANVQNRSGELSGSLTTAIKRKGGRATARIGAQKGSKGYYATMVEYGHGGPHPAGPHPFLTPAFDAEAENAYGIIKQELTQATGKNGE